MSVMMLDPPHGGYERVVSKGMWSCHPIQGQPSGQECGLVRAERRHPLHTKRSSQPRWAAPQIPTEEPTKWRLRKQFTCLQDLAHTESTNETLPIGLSQAKFPGTAGRPSARDLLEPPSEQHMSSKAFLLFCIYRQAWPPLPFDWIAVSWISFFPM